MLFDGWTRAMVMSVIRVADLPSVLYCCGRCPPSPDLTVVSLHLECLLYLTLPCRCFLLLHGTQFYASS